MNNKKITTAMLALIILLLSGGGVLFIKNANKHGSGMGLMDGAMASSTDGLPVNIKTVTDQKGELGDLSNSWPGEIISFGDIQIQPRRGGTIIEWNVNIGQKVRAGQVIARLSAPPAMPELTSMLAEQAKMVTEARIDAKAQIDFAEKKKQQLVALRSVVDASRNNAADMLNVSRATGDTISAQTAIIQARKATESDQKKIRSSLEQSIRRELQMFTHNEIDVVSFYNSVDPLPRLYVMESFGKISGSSRFAYLVALNNVLKEMTKENGNLEAVGAEYFAAATRMAGATTADDEVTSSQLTEVRRMIAMDQMAFLDAVKEYQMSQAELTKMEVEYKLMLAEKETDYAMQKKEIEEQVAMLDKDIAMNGGRVAAAEASYYTVAGSINGDLSIVAPSNGVITSIMKKNGDFVEPGMAIASLNNGRNSDKFVRFKIPSNIRLPKPGSELVVARPGFPNETHKLKLIGVGTALDSSGSYMADAKFAEDVYWPVNVSVRVMPNGSSSSSLFVSINAIEWGSSSSSVWIVKADNTITRRVIKTGRTLGESVEIYEGLSIGDKYVGKLISGLKEGVLVREGEIVKPMQQAEDEHGHNE